MSEDDARTRILNVAGPIFAEKGFQATTIREICGQANVNVAAVNYHFGDKEHLYTEAVKRAHQPSGQPDELLEWPPGTTPETKLRDQIKAMLTRMLSERTPWQRQLMNREMLEPTFACRELVEAHIRDRFGQLLDILGEILPADVPAYRCHQVAFSIVGQALHYHVASHVVTVLVGEEEREAHYQIDQLVDHITQFSLAAMGLASPLAP
ncbi:MAG: CerR family C-terminal domain-containing protein [Planctomycetes bacterium]|nr:CerR family C-terminal domain-containing protein [Planctomycetota bacterium]MBL7038270.1 CerR family C-terminal domain-containing protein [Pirellulaceae bacterium]